MLVLLVAVISGVAIAYFGMQNISPVTIRLNDYVWNDVPLYLVIVGSLFVGLFMAWILYFARSVDHLWKRSSDEKSQTYGSRSGTAGPRTRSGKGGTQDHPPFSV